MCALLLKPHTNDHQQARWWTRPIHGFFRIFNAGFEELAAGYGWFTARIVRVAVVMLVVYAAIIGYRPQRVPQDAGRVHPAASTPAISSS